MNEVEKVSKGKKKTITTETTKKESNRKQKKNRKIIFPGPPTAKFKKRRTGQALSVQHTHKKNNI
jgi:hypothetical protein